MPELKIYQQKALDTLRDYCRECCRTDAELAFFEMTRRKYERGLSYNTVKELPGLPYVCIRIPTGGGKTLVGCHTVGVAAKELLHAYRCVVLWLVPSNAIKDQTLKALRDRKHFYRQALESAIGSIAVFDAIEARFVAASTYSTETVIIVSTLQAFRVDETEGRKVYEESGALVSHTENLPLEVTANMRKYENGVVIASLENVLRKHRPIVIMDEAHNARTPLSFEMLARFSPSCIIEFTATPDTESNPSNVLYSVSAAELQAEDMIKMPIRLETRPHWKELLADAIATLSQLEKIARAEREKTCEFIRPVMLLQAQPHRKDEPTLTFEVVKECLLNDHRIPEEEIAIATGTKWELDNIDLSDPDCRIKYVITVQALKEGWDCPFAYVLCSVAELRSTTAVEQILGRVMRLPNAKRKIHGELNLAYAFVASQRFAQAAESLTDALIENGFNRQEARDFITPAPVSDEELPLFAINKVAVVLNESPDLTRISKEITDKLSFDHSTKTLTFTGVMGDDDREALENCVTLPESQTAIARIYRESRGWVVTEKSSPAERGEKFSIPVLSVKQGELFEQFEETHFLELGWGLEACEASFTEAEFASERQGGERGEIVIDESGKVKAKFITSLQNQMTLIAGEQWNVGQLVNWLERSIPHFDLEPDDFAQFMRRLVRDLIELRGLSLDYLIHNKYKLRQAAEEKVEQYRKEARRKAYQSFLLPNCPSPLITTPEKCFTFDPNSYPYNIPYRGVYEFRKHYYKIVGDLKSDGEELECVKFIDSLDAIRYFIRNPVGHPTHSFWLPTSSDRFYPDFVCQLYDGRYLVTEYKNANDWSNADSTEKREIGELWEARSNGKCLFIMPRGMDFEAIRAKIRTKELSFRF
jgi:type III restriction enzyme